MITDYKILTQSTPELLTEAVMAHLQSFWRPLGGVAVVVEDDGDVQTFLQAMVKGEFADEYDQA